MGTVCNKHFTSWVHVAQTLLDLLAKKTTCTKTIFFCTPPLAALACWLWCLEYGHDQSLLAWSPQRKSDILRCLLLSALLFPFLFFLSSPNSVSTLRGSYGCCKGRCLIRVLTLVPSIFPVNFHVAHILPQSTYVPPIVIYTRAMYLLPIYYLCTLTTLHVLNIYRTYHTFQ